MVKLYNILLVYFHNVLLKQIQVILVLNIVILVNDQLVLETFVHQISVTFALSEQFYKMVRFSMAKNLAI